MVTEDYVSRETYNLLKEKGYDGEFKTRYNMEEGYTYTALHRYDIMKWLREVHGIHINVFRYPAAFLDDNNKLHKPWWFQYTLLKPINEIDTDSHMMNDEFESAEEAMDYAIKYCLENLI